MAVFLRKGKISVQDSINAVRSDRFGAVSVFIGMVRKNSEDSSRSGALSKVVRLEYSAYEKMALKKMREVERSARQKWSGKGLGKIAMTHRLGRLKVGAISVVVSVSAVHRKESILACRFCIDRIKHTAPIFKKEFYSDGKSFWVGC